MKWLFFFALFGFISGPLISFSVRGVHVSLLDSSVLILMLYWLITAKNKKNVFILYSKLIAPFIIISLISLIISLLTLPFSEVMLSSLYLFRFVLYTSMCMISYENNQIAKILPQGLFISGVILSILGILQYFFYPDLRNLTYLGWDPHSYRIFGTLLDPNFMALIYLLSFILGVYLCLLNKKTNKMLFLGLIILSVAFLLTYSRGGYVAFGLVSSTFLVIKKKFRWLLLLVLVFLAVLILLPKPGGEGVNLLRTMSISSRIKNSQEAIALFLKNPVIGVGFNTLKFTRVTLPESTDPSYPQHSVSGFHNSYLFILATTGIFGFLGYVLIWKNVVGKSNENPLLVYSLIAIGVHSFFDNSFFYPYVMIWLWFLVGWSLRKMST